MDDIVNEAQRSPLNGKSKLEICFYDFNGKRKKIQKNDSCLVKVKFFSPHFKQMNVNQKIRLEKSLYVNYDLKYWNNQYMIVTNDKSDTIAFQIYIYAKNVKFIDFDGKEYNSIPLCLNYFFPKDFKKN